MANRNYKYHTILLIHSFKCWTLQYFQSTGSQASMETRRRILLLYNWFPCLSTSSKTFFDEFIDFSMKRENILILSQLQESLKFKEETNTKYIYTNKIKLKIKKNETSVSWKNKSTQRERKKEKKTRLKSSTLPFFKNL